MRGVEVFDLGDFFVELIGARDGDDPKMVVQARCGRCGLIIKRTKFDVSKPIGDVDAMGASDAKLVTEHLRVFHGLCYD